MTRTLSTTAAALVALALLYPSPTLWAAPPDEALSSADSRAAPLIFLEWEGQLRLRAQLLDGASLGDTSSANKLSGVPASLSVRPLNAAQTNKRDLLGTSDLRLRLEPTLHVGSRAKIQSQIDVAGTLIMGAQPRDEADGVIGKMTLRGGQGSAPSSLAIRRLWASYDILGIAELVVGRTPDHFGLGLLRNDGRDEASDFQSDVDRVGLRAELFGLRLSLSRDLMATLPVVATSKGTDSPTWGLQNSTDVVRWLAEIHGGAKEDQVEGFAWGGALSYQDQELALAAEHGSDMAAALQDDCLETGACATLVPRDSSMIWGQLYLRWGQKTALGLLRAELEGDLVFATVDNTDVLANTDTSTTWLAAGTAARLSLKRPNTNWLLDLGYASGEGEGGFGVLDQDNFRRLDLPDQPHRSFLTGMHFHRGFLVDGLLFREIIGAVSNTFYARPSWRVGLVDFIGVGRFELELGLMSALAARQGSTPGKALLLGVEPELRLDLISGTHGTGRLDFSYLVPGAAFDKGSGGERAPHAWRLGAQWVLGF